MHNEVLTDALIELIESGSSIIVGTRDRDHRPDCGRGIGAYASPDRRRVTVLLNGALCDRLRSNLADNGCIAVTFSRIRDHHSVQVKGQAVAVREGTLEDCAVSERYLIAFAEQVSLAGLPRSVTRNVVRIPCLAVEVEVQATFNQTPGPAAGQSLS